MATEIVRWCDVHMGRDEKVAGELVTVALGGRPAKGLDLCPGCKDEVVKPLEALLDEFGSVLPATSSRGATGRRKAVPEGATPLPVPVDPDGQAKAHPCLFCDSSFTTGEGAFGHMMRTHGTPKAAGELIGTVCPVCGYDTNSGSPGVHIAQGHKDYGFPSVLSSLLWARDNGDPFGVYAGAIAKGHA